VVPDLADIDMSIDDLLDDIHQYTTQEVVFCCVALLARDGFEQIAPLIPPRYRAEVEKVMGSSAAWTKSSPGTSRSRTSTERSSSSGRNDSLRRAGLHQRRQSHDDQPDAAVRTRRPR
jgi:hypothetical protein